MAYKHFWVPGTWATGQIEQTFSETTSRCPFCHNPYNVAEPRINGKACQICCPSCGAEGPQSDKFPEPAMAVRQALTLWNRQQS